MIDLKLLNVCDHKITQSLDIEGMSPNYFSDLEYECNPNLTTIKIFNSNTATAIELFSLQGVGISNFYVDSSNQRIVFGRYDVNAGMNFPDPDSAHIPADKYICSYVARTATCPKCKGKKITNDVFIDNTGRISEISGVNKVRQQILKILTTTQGNNIYDSSFGSIANNLIGTKMDAFAAASLQFSLLDALNNLIQIQQANNLPDNETIHSISDINATQDSADPRKINIIITVMLKSFEQLSTSVSMQF